MMNRENAIRNYIESLFGEELNRIMFYLADDTNEFVDLVWYDMDVFNLMFDGTNPFQIAGLVSHGNFDTNDTYFRLDSYGNLESTDNHGMAEDCLYWSTDIANYCVRYADENTDTGNDTLNRLIRATEDTMFNDEYEEQE